MANGKGGLYRPTALCSQSNQSTKTTSDSINPKKNKNATNARRKNHRITTPKPRKIRGSGF